MVFSNILTIGAKAYTKILGWKTQKDLITFYSYTPLSGNSGALYEYAIETGIPEKYGLKLIWLTGNKKEADKLKSMNIEAYSIRTLEGLTYFIRSNVHVADHFPFDTTRLFKGSKTTVVLTWHGIGFKTRSSMADPGNSAKNVNRFVDIAISTSRLANLFLSTSLLLSYEKFVVTGYPRQDLLIKTNPSKIKKKILNVYSIGLDINKIILYAPTWRIEYYSSVSKVKRMVGEPLKSPLNFSESELQDLCNILEKTNSILLIKYHPFDESYYIDNNVVEPLRPKCKRILVVKTMDLIRHGLRTSHLLLASDLLITDYSSVFHDYLLLDKPIIFYFYDFYKYLKEINLVLDDKLIDVLLPGQVALKPKELHRYLTDFLNERLTDFPKRNYVKQLFHYYTDGRSSERVWKLILDKI